MRGRDLLGDTLLAFPCRSVFGAPFPAHPSLSRSLSTRVCLFFRVVSRLESTLSAFEYLADDAFPAEGDDSTRSLPEKEQEALRAFRLSGDCLRAGEPAKSIKLALQTLRCLVEARLSPGTERVILALLLLAQGYTVLRRGTVDTRLLSLALVLAIEHLGTIAEVVSGMGGILDTLGCAWERHGEPEKAKAVRTRLEYCRAGLVAPDRCADCGLRVSAEQRPSPRTSVGQQRCSYCSEARETLQQLSS